MHRDSCNRSSAHHKVSSRSLLFRLSPHNLLCFFGDYHNERIPFLLSISEELYYLHIYAFCLHVSKDFAVELLGFSFSLHSKDLRRTRTETERSLIRLGHRIFVILFRIGVFLFYVSSKRRNSHITVFWDFRSDIGKCSRLEAVREGVREG
jgi:hypothetical protein